MFLNLLTNAREASRQGGRDLRRAPSPLDQRLDITIADTGAGSPRSTCRRVLEPFFTTKTNGNGLGLSICRSILWEVGGTLTFRASPAIGTRVHVAVPWAAARPGCTRMKKPARILVVDDEPGMLRAVERVLGRAHHCRRKPVVGRRR